MDGIDVYDRYGIFITEGSYLGLLSYAPLKSPETVNDWAEEDGLEIDLSDPHLDTKEVDISFVGIDDYTAGDFIDAISDGSYHTYVFCEIGLTCSLRLVDETNHLKIIRAEPFKLKFADDFPLSDYEYLAPDSDMVPVQGYEIDGTDLSEYGIMVLEGSEAQILKSPAVKSNLLRNLPDRNGVMYDGHEVHFQTKEVTLYCCMVADTIAHFWRNYNAFLYDLIKAVEVTDDDVTYMSGERSLYVDSTSEEYPCHYKMQRVSLWDSNGDIWCKFALTLVFTSFRVGSEEVLLASEASEFITTEDGEFYIDLKRYGN